ncbi:MAG: alkaline phosphatase family protein [Cyanobacteriota bacterium]
MKKKFVFKLNLILFIVAIFSYQSAFAKDFTKHVIIISIDGLRPDVLLTTKTPHLNEQWKKGSYSFKAQTIVPSLTLPSHTSMLTGVTFEKHKVDWNDFDKNKSITVKTIFEYAKEKQLSTAMFVAKEKFKHFNKNNSLDIFSKPVYDFKLVLASAEKHILESKPNLSFIHLAEIDGTGHIFGWDSFIQRGMLETMDKPIGDFLAKIKENISDAVIIITSDHGGHCVFHGSSESIDTTIPWIAIGKNININYEIKQKINTYDTTSTALWLLGLEENNIDGVPIKEIIENNVF